MKNNGIAILARRDALTEEEWYLLVEARLGLLKPHLRNMSLKTVGEIRMIHDYFHTHSIARDNPKVFGDQKFDLQTRGIFPSDISWAAVSRNTEHERDELQRSVAQRDKIWGLSRNCEWLGIEVYTTRSDEPYKYPGRTEEVARARSVTIGQASLREICIYSNRTPEEIWERLGEVIKEWADHRKNLYREAQNLVEQITGEEALVEVIPRSL